MLNATSCFNFKVSAAYTPPISGFELFKIPTEVFFLSELRIPILTKERARMEKKGRQKKVIMELGCVSQC